MLSSGSTRYQRPNRIVDACAAGVPRVGNHLILEEVCGDAVKRVADLNHEPVAEALLARFVVVLRALMSASAE